MALLTGGGATEAIRAAITRCASLAASLVSLPGSGVGRFAAG